MHVYVKTLLNAALIRAIVRVVEPVYEIWTDPGFEILTVKA